MASNQPLYRAGGAPRGGPRGGARGGGRGGRGGFDNNNNGGNGGNNNNNGNYNNAPGGPPGAPTMFVRGGRGGRGARGGGGRPIVTGLSTRYGGAAGGAEGSLELSGLPPGIEYADFVAFVNQYMSGIRYNKLTLSGVTARMTLKSSDLATVASALSGKLVSIGYALRVTHGLSAGRVISNVERESLRSAIRASYQSASHVLDLSNLANRCNLPCVDFHSHNFATELLNAIGAEAPDVVTINLSSNAIQTLNCFAAMSRAVPHMLNLSLQNNQIASVDQLEHLAGYRDKLRELLLSSNPLFIAFTSSPGAPAQLPGQLDHGVFQQYVSSIFPNLQLLDSAPLLGLIDFDLPPALGSNPQESMPDVKDSFFDSEPNKRMCLSFVRRYLELYDADRQSTDLIAVYAPHAMFSMSYQSDSSVSNIKYTEQNRNVLALGMPKLRAAKEVSLLRTKPVSIVAALHALPPSKHDTGSITADVVQLNAGSLDLSQSGGVLLSVIIRGHFLETETILRCYHRTFLLTGPTPQARTSNWPVSILNDSLYIGAVKLNVPAASPAAAVYSGSVPPSPLQPPPGSPQSVMTADDHRMVQSLCAAGGVDPAVAMDALKATQGNPDQALERINQARANGQLPPRQ